MSPVPPIAAPIGMQDYRPQDGRYVRGAASMHPAYALHMSARDLARFGLLYLHSGRWAARELVPSAWVHESTTAHSETNGHNSYGYLWWTSYANRRIEPMNIAAGGFWADGHLGQYVVIDPAHDLVVVHQSESIEVDHERMGHLMWLLLKAARASEPGDDPLRQRRP